MFPVVSALPGLSLKGADAAWSEGLDDDPAAGDAADQAGFGGIFSLMAAGSAMLLPPLAAPAIPEDGDSPSMSRHGGGLLPQPGNPLPPWLLAPALPEHHARLAAVQEPLLTRPAWAADRLGLVETLHSGAGGARAEVSVSSEFSTLLAGQGGTARAMATSALPTGAAAPPLLPGAPDFDRSLGQRLIGFVQNGVQDARVRVHPAHLGPIEIRLRLDGEGLQLNMVSPHAAVREALEAALPRLRDTLAEAGVQLAQADVGSGEARSGEERGASRQDGASASAEEGSPEPGGDDGMPAPRRIALVDTFA